MPKFDQLIKDGELVKAAYLFAEEGYENGEFGFTRKQLIESLAKRVQELEDELKQCKDYVLKEQNKRYREAIGNAEKELMDKNYPLDVHVSRALDILVGVLENDSE